MLTTARGGGTHVFLTENCQLAFQIEYFHFHFFMGGDPLGQPTLKVLS